MANQKIFKPEAPQTFPLVDTPEGKKVSAFGLLWPYQSDISIHLNAFRMGLTREQGGLGPFNHFLSAYCELWPWRAKGINPWFVKRIKTFIYAPERNERIISLASGGGCAKSADVAYYAMCWWWANPTERSVIVGSTTLSALKKRIWHYMTEAVNKAAYHMPGDINSSQAPSIHYSKNDLKHRIHGVALKPGESEKTISDIIGIHPDEGLLFIVDEATDVAPAVLDVQTNLDESDKGKFFQMILMGNSSSRFDPHGRASEPEEGWESVDPDIDEEWKTKLGGRCLYFDCYKSPAVIGKEKYRHNYSFLINQKKIDSEAKRLGEDSPAFWRFVRGFWPPEDTSKTVLTLTMVDRHNANRPARWSGTWQVQLAGLDPAFTSEGDECILRFATLGLMDNGVVGLDFGGPENVVSLALDARSPEPATYQVIRQARDICIARGVEPENFGMDTWGFGAGAGDVIEKEWSPEIHKIVGIGKPSDDFTDGEMLQKASEVYDRRITELWFAMRTFVQSGQIRGLDKSTIEEFCSRTYEWRGRKIVLEGKRDYKKRMGRSENPTGSPDKADAAVIIVEVAKRHGFTPGAREINSHEKLSWQSRWEEMRFGEQIDEREAMWGGDAILESSMFGAWDEE